MNYRTMGYVNLLCAGLDFATAIIFGSGLALGCALFAAGTAYMCFKLEGKNEE